MVEETDLLDVQETKKPSTSMMESTLRSDWADSRTLVPVNLGEDLFVGGSQAVDLRHGLDLMEKEGGTARGAKRRGQKNT